MNPPGRKLMNFRLTDDCRRLLALLAEQKGVSMAAVIELLVRDEARRTDVETWAKIAA